MKGKQAVSNNALKHGVFSKSLILDDWSESILSELDSLFEQPSLDLKKIKDIAPHV